jgi:hypothetical protein
MMLAPQMMSGFAAIAVKLKYHNCERGEQHHAAGTSFIYEHHLPQANII